MLSTNWDRSHHFSVEPRQNPSVWVNSTATARSKFAGYSISTTATGYYNPDDGFIYIPAFANSNVNGSLTPWDSSPVYGMMAVVCIDVGLGNGPPALCATRHYVLAETPTPLQWYSGVDSTHGHAVFMTSVKRYYFMDQYQVKLYCWLVLLASRKSWKCIDGSSFVLPGTMLRN